MKVQPSIGTSLLRIFIALNPHEWMWTRPSHGERVHALLLSPDAASGLIDRLAVSLCVDTENSSPNSNEWSSSCGLLPTNDDPGLAHSLRNDRRRGRRVPLGWQRPHSPPEESLGGVRQPLSRCGDSPGGSGCPSRRRR